MSLIEEVISPDEREIEQLGTRKSTKIFSNFTIFSSTNQLTIDLRVQF